MKREYLSKRNKMTVFDVALLVVLVFYTLFFFLLLLWGFFTALKPSDFTIMDNIVGLPKGSIFEWEWGNFSTVLQKMRAPYRLENGDAGYYGLDMLFVNTIIYAGGNAFLHTIVPCTIAYLCVKYPCAFSKLIHSLVLFTMMLPIVGSGPSMIRVLYSLNIYNTWIGNFAQNCTFLGLYFLVLHSIIQGLNKELWEAAEMDGANQWAIYVTIILPILINTLGLVFMLNFINFWNEYQTALLYLPGYPTLSVGIYLLSLDQQPFFSWLPGRLASFIMFIMPILILFLIFKDKIMGNIAIGGVKE